MSSSPWLDQRHTRSRPGTPASVPTAPRTPHYVTDPRRLDGEPRRGALDDDLVRVAQERITALLDEELKARDQQGRPTAADTERVIAGNLLEQVIPTLVAERARQGQPVPDRAQDVELREAVLAEMFGLGRLEPLLSHHDVENIDIVGCEPAVLTLTDGTTRIGQQVASTDDELIRLLRRIAERRARSERSFNSAEPRLNLELPGGQRLAAVMGVSPRPQVSIRIHRFREITLDQLVKMGTVSRAQRHLLGAAVRAGKNIVVTGEQKAGKTTLLRGLCWDIPVGERFATLETEFELGLHHFPGRFPPGSLLPLETQQGNQERNDAGGQVGGIGLAELVWQSLRMHTSRLIVGEVRGTEIIPMLDAMSTGGAGSLSTVHARSARGAVQRMISLCLGANPSWNETFAHRLISESVDLIVHLRLDRNPGHAGSTAGGLDRYIDEIVTVEQGEGGRTAFTELFRPDPHRRAGTRGVPTGHRPVDLDDYVEAGFDPRMLETDGGGGWILPSGSGTVR